MSTTITITIDNVAQGGPVTKPFRTSDANGDRLINSFLTIATQRTDAQNLNLPPASQLPPPTRTDAINLIATEMWAQAQRMDYGETVRATAASATAGINPIPAA